MGAQFRLLKVATMSEQSSFDHELLTVVGIGLRSDSADEAFLTVDVAPMLNGGDIVESLTYGGRITASVEAEATIRKLRGDGGVVLITRNELQSIVGVLGLTEVPTRTIVTECPTCGRVVAKHRDHETDTTTLIRRVGSEKCKICVATSGN
jgi:hypothetical protein